MNRFVKYAFYVLAAAFFLLQVVNLIKNGPSRDTLVVISELLLVVWLGIIFVLQLPLRFILKIIPSKMVRFVLLGYVSTVVAETVYIFSKPLHQNLVIDLILTTPWYILWMIAWFYILRRYNFSIHEAFILGGFHGFVVEGILSGFLFGSPILAIVSIPLFSMIYGCFFIVPYLVLKPDFDSQNAVTLPKKAAVSLIPLLAYIPGFIWILMLTAALKLTLH
jgi:hypothetical protein